MEKFALLGDSHTRSYATSHIINNIIFLGQGKKLNFLSRLSTANYTFRYLMASSNCLVLNKPIALVLGEPDVRYITYSTFDLLINPEYLVDDLSDEEEEDEDYLQKIDDDLHNHFLQSFHPELLQHNYEEVAALTKVTRNKEGIIIDPLHRTLPFITRYERAKILGERASQLEAGAKPMIKVEPNVLDGYLIALKEFEEKKIPFIVKRPLPNGSCEYWKLQDLEII